MLKEKETEKEILYLKEYLKGIKGRFSTENIIQQLNNLKDLKVLVIGDTIIDEYSFTIPKGRANKDPILSLDFVKSERYAGGILAIANHIAGFVNTLNLITILGDRSREEEFVRSNIRSNITPYFATKKESPTILKKRYIDYMRQGKLFKVEYINDRPIDAEVENEIIGYLKTELPKYDLVVVGDFGHGFITNGIIKTLEQHSKYLAANVQTNSSNIGFNYITKYSRIDYLTSNESEIRLALTDSFGSFDDVIRKLKERTRFSNILITQGGEGCLYIKGDNNYSGPALMRETKDVVGAGDAVFAITALLNYKNIDEYLLVFIANCVGAIAVNIMGNKTSVTKEELIKLIEELK